MPDVSWSYKRSSTVNGGLVLPCRKERDKAPWLLCVPEVKRKNWRIRDESAKKSDGRILRTLRNRSHKGSHLSTLSENPCLADSCS